jgi:hypothetical protein
MATAPPDSHVARRRPLAADVRPARSSATKEATAAMTTDSTTRPELYEAASSWLSG